MPNIKHQPRKRQLQTVLRFKWNTTLFSIFFPKRTGLVIHMLSQPALSPRHFLVPVTPSPGATPRLLHVGAVNYFQYRSTELNHGKLSQYHMAKYRAWVQSTNTLPVFVTTGISWRRKGLMAANDCVQCINSKDKFTLHSINLEGLEKSSPLGTCWSLGGECKIPAKGQILSKLSPIYFKMCQCTAARRVGAWCVSSSVQNQKFPNFNKKDSFLLWEDLTVRIVKDLTPSTT